MSKLSEMLENCKKKENEWLMANSVTDYKLTVDRNGGMSVTMPEHTVDIADSAMKYIQSSITTGTTSGSTSQVTTSNTTGSINSGYLTIDPNLIYNNTYITTTPYTTQPSYNGFRIPSSVYTEDKVTRELLESYANDSFIFDKDSKIMIYKDKNGDYFIQESFKRIEAEDIEKELISKKDASVLQSTVDEYFGK